MENGKFSQKLKYCPKIKTVVNMKSWSKIACFVKNWNLCQKLEFLSKIGIFVKNWNFCQKIGIFAKILISLKNRDFGHKFLSRIVIS